MKTKQGQTAGRKVYADYFLALHTRSVSGNADAWRLYTNDAAEFNPLASAKGHVQISGDLYKTADLKDVCSTYYPLIGPYDTLDEDVAEYHVLLAKAAGIDGFLGEWAYEGMIRDYALLNVAKVAARYGFAVGANWCEYGHFTWQNFRDREESMEAAKRGFLHLLEHVYKPCGIQVDGRPLVLLFDARPEKATSPKQAFFGPDDIVALKKAAQEAGYDPLILTRNAHEGMLGAADGYFRWVTPYGSDVPENGSWTSMGDRAFQVECLRDYYAKCEKWQTEGQIALYLGGVWPGFDDHKGQAWGTGERRYVPRDNGQTLKDTWAELRKSPAEIAFIIAWNDWEEATNIEPSLELGYADIEECARQIAEWKGTPLHLALLRLPERLFRLRKRVRAITAAGMARESLEPLIRLADEAAQCISGFAEPEARSRMAAAENTAAQLESLLHRESIHVLWEYPLPPAGLEAVWPTGAAAEKKVADGVAGLSLDRALPELQLVVSEPVRGKLQGAHAAGRLSFEYLDMGTDFVQVLVDAEDERHRVIADFRKQNTGKWRTATLDLVNARFVKGLAGSADILIRQSQGSAGAVRMARIDAAAYRVERMDQ